LFRTVQYIYIRDVPFGAAMKVLPGAESYWCGAAVAGGDVHEGEGESESLQMRVQRHKREVENEYLE
jgi:hypothetical protein